MSQLIPNYPTYISLMFLPPNTPLSGYDTSPPYDTSHIITDEEEPFRVTAAFIKAHPEGPKNTSMRALVSEIKSWASIQNEVFYCGQSQTTH